MALGLSFAPTSANAAENAQQLTNQTPIQNAIRVLSLRMPTFVGARGIAPDVLFNAPGSAGLAGSFGAGGLEQFLRKLFLPDPWVASAGMQAPRSVPTTPLIPRFVPGSGNGSASPDPGEVNRVGPTPRPLPDPSVPLWRPQLPSGGRIQVS